LAKKFVRILGINKIDYYTIVFNAWKICWYNYCENWKFRHIFTYIFFSSCLDAGLLHSHAIDLWFFFRALKSLCFLAAAFSLIKFNYILLLFLPSTWSYLKKETNLQKEKFSVRQTGMSAW
jgi:hypothetical protein